MTALAFTLAILGWLCTWVSGIGVGSDDLRNAIPARLAVVMLIGLVLIITSVGLASS